MTPQKSLLILGMIFILFFGLLAGFAFAKREEISNAVRNRTKISAGAELAGAVDRFIGELKGRRAK